MGERKAALETLVAQIREVLRELRGREHPLVDDRAGGEARDRQAVAPVELDHAADHVELAFERVLVLDAVTRLDEELLDARRHGARGPAAGLVLDRHLAPAEHPLALRLHRALKTLAGLVALLPGEEAERHPVPARLGQLEVGLGAQECVGQLDQDPRSVSRVRVGALGPAVLEVLERPEGAGDHLMRGRCPQARHESDTAGIVLVARVVQAGRCPRRGSPPRVPRLLRAGARRGWGAKMIEREAPGSEL